MTPTDLLNVAELGITSGNAWDSKYPSLNAGFITQTDYLQHHIDMRDAILLQINTSDVRNQAILGLKESNDDISKYAKFIKTYLEEEYDTDSKTYYVGYGIVMPKDNDHRMRSLDTLITELNKVGNPLKNKKYGLTFWTALRDKHRTNWTNLKVYDGDRSMNSNNLKVAKKDALSYQSRLRSIIKIMHPTNYKSVYRDFGFQSEKY